MRHHRIAVGAGVYLSAALFAARVCADPPESGFAFEPAGHLPPKTGTGRQDATVYAPGMRFPLESAPAYLNSQVHGHGGVGGPKGTHECNAPNFSYPWRDNYCETRSWPTPLCPSGQGHQGQDIRGATCDKNKHVVVAVADGMISSVGEYSVSLISGGTRFLYLHMDKVSVKGGQAVKRGEPIGKVSNKFFKDGAPVPTTAHLHFEIWQNVAGVGQTPVPPYTSLVSAYQELLGLPISQPDPPAPTPTPTSTTAATAAGTTEAPATAAPVTGTTSTAPAAQPQKGGCGCGIVGGGGGAGGLGAALLVIASLLARRRPATRQNT